MISFSTLRRRPVFWFWFIAATLVGLLSASMPLFDTIGYEHALLLALFSALAAGQMAAGLPSRAREGRMPLNASATPVIGLYFRALTMGLAIAGWLLIISLINGLLVGFCNLLEGLAFFLLLPVPAVAFATAMGLIAGLVTKGAKRASAIWLAIYGLFLLAACVSFYATPAVYIFNPLFGYFPGVLYDTLIKVERPLITYRLATVCQVLAIVSWTSCLYGTGLRADPTRLKRRVRHMALAAMFTLAAIGWNLAGPALGHGTSRSRLEDQLGKAIHTESLDLFFPEETDPKLVQALTKDARFSLHQVESYLGVGATRRIAVFFFKNARHKKKAIGAGNTNVAKPWREEVYVTLEEPPHPVLRHELVHAVSSALGMGPFAVSGRWRGLLPNPGLIEGLATAAQGPRGDLTLHQWAAAMRRRHLLPRIDQLFGFGFFDLNARRAYTAAGSFCAWIKERYGALALRKAYRASRFEEATGRSLDDLEADWHRFLDTVPLIGTDQAAAKHRFDRPPIIRTRCVHEVARLDERADRLIEQGSMASARSLMKDAFTRSGQSTETKRRLFLAEVGAGNHRQVSEMATALLADKTSDEVFRNSVLEILADLDAAKPGSMGKPLGDRYRALAAVAEDDDTKRRLTVKAHLSDLQSPSSAALIDILAAHPGPRSISPPLAALIIAEAATRLPQDPVLAYLIARQYYNQRDFSTARARLEVALALGLEKSDTSLGLAAKMLRAESLYRLGKLKEAHDAFAKIAAAPAVRPGTRELCQDWAERAAFKNR